jgi:hypothetical protein
MKPSTSEDVGKEKFSGQHLGQLYPALPSFRRLGKRLISGKMNFDLFYVVSKPHRKA